MGTCRLCGIHLGSNGCGDRCCNCCNQQSKSAMDKQLIADMRYEASARLPPQIRWPNFRGEPVRRNLV